MTSGAITTGAGTLTLGGNVTTNTNAVAATILGNLSLGGTTRTFTVASGGGAADLNISAVITNGGTAAGLTKAGTGTLVLSGANTYTGATTLNAGTLVVDGA